MHTDFCRAYLIHDAWFFGHRIHTIAAANVMRLCLKTHVSNGALGLMHAIKKAACAVWGS